MGVGGRGGGVSWPDPPYGAPGAGLASEGSHRGLSWPGFLPAFISNRRVSQPCTVDVWGWIALCGGAVYAL